MTQHSNIFYPALEDVLTHVSKAAMAIGIDFYLAGAVARDYHLSKDSSYEPSRKTEDIDIAVMVATEEEFILLKQQLLATGFFEEHQEPIKLIYKSSIELDLLPFGDIEDAGVTTLMHPKAFTMDMPGFMLLNEHTENAAWSNNINVRVCSIEGIVLLKLIANNDKPQRTKDLIDIQQIIKLYFDVYSDDVYEMHFDVMELYDTNDRDYKQKICAHVIGRKLKTILSKDPQLLQRITSILQQDKDAFWSELLKGLLE